MTAFIKIGGIRATATEFCIRRSLFAHNDGRAVCRQILFHGKKIHATQRKKLNPPRFTSATTH